jgi:sarcosine oxidase
MGSAALYQAARRGVRAIGIDRFSPPHDRGSSHGESRITRQAIGEGDAYVPFALRSHEIWRDLETETTRSLLVPCGGLILGRPSTASIHGQTDFAGNTIRAAKRFGIPHEVLNPDEVMRRYPQFRLAGDETCYSEPGAGFLRPEVCVSTQLELASRLGANVRLDENVLRLSADAHAATVITDAATYSAGHVIVTAGAWAPNLLGERFDSLLSVYLQTMYWFEPQQPRDFAPGRFPIFIWRHGAADDDHFYGFPVVDEGVKVATEQFSQTTSPDALRLDRDSSFGASRSAAQQMHRAHVRDILNGVSERCLRTTTCLYTVTPDFGFIIDRHPDYDRVLVASPCSGHGFKHSAAVGESLAEWAIEGKSNIDLSAFSLRRFERRGSVSHGGTE